ncbi:odorant receptor 59a-like [Anastrepha ludens]|uniref:odorant receptor 59a-like n=1 Tax=Anastrepha ludens TaxID=28586 RepID=UPI0023AE7C00|nr:odorant receptor 59a-like [Anastrepha ludens]
MSRSPVNSRQFFRAHWRLWLLLGCVREPVRYQLLYRLYSTGINTLIIVVYPGTILLALCNSTNSKDLLQALPICAGAFACSAKYVSYQRSLRLVRQVEQLFNVLDERIQLAEDRNYFAAITRNTNVLLNVFRSVCVFFFIVTIISFISSIGERGLAFAVALPFDWRASTLRYVGVVTLELLLLTCDLLQSMANDSFPAIALCVLSSHTRLLGVRLARIGHKSKDEWANVVELQRCIVDHQHLHRLHATLQEIISMPVFVQYAVTAFQDCFTVITLVFYARNASDRLLYCMYLLALQLQIFPTCYYGTVCANSMDDLRQHAYASNWVEQSRLYRRLMCIFAARSMKITMAYAAGIIPIHLGAFLATLKAAYSFYTFVEGVRK